MDYERNIMCQSTLICNCLSNYKHAKCNKIYKNESSWITRIQEFGRELCLYKLPSTKGEYHFLIINGRSRYLPSQWLMRNWRSISVVLPVKNDTVQYHRDQANVISPPSHTRSAVMLCVGKCVVRVCVLQPDHRPAHLSIAPYTLASDFCPVINHAGLCSCEHWFQLQASICGTADEPRT